MTNRKCDERELALAILLSEMNVFGTEWLHATHHTHTHTHTPQQLIKENGLDREKLLQTISDMTDVLARTIAEKLMLEGDDEEELTNLLCE